MRTKLTREITADEVRAYHQAGVVLLRGVLDLPTVNTMRACIDDGVKSIGASPAGYDLSALRAAYEASDDEQLRSRDGGQHDVSGISNYIRQSGKPFLLEAAKDADGSFYLDTALSSRHDKFRRLIMRGALADIAGALLCSEEVRYYNDQLFIKEPRTKQKTAFHQDAAYFNIEGDDCCTMWVPVDPVTLVNGALQYVRGSHLDGRYYAPNVFVSQTSLPGASEEPVPDIEGDPASFDIVHFDTEPGDVLVHHYRTLHGAGGNLSRYQPRRALRSDMRATTSASRPAPARRSSFI